ncbi:MAG: helix-turn-helix transcriptional regulator [Candidatus Contendobacter sp.]|jgi:antitoxin HicB|nr:helix-turn-helix transcriptional regulator [Candidatus Contendobacter sp.]
MNAAYPYTMEPQESGGYLIQFVDLDEAFTEGATEEEAAFNAAEVLSLVIEQRLADGQAIPLPSPDEGRPVAYPQASVQAALLMRQAREEQGRTLAELARALQTSWPSAQRLEQATNNPTLKQLERAAAALGKRLTVGIV